MNRFVIHLFFSLPLVLGLAACEKYLDVNENPNQPGSNTLPLSAKLPAALLSTAIQETGQLNQVGAFWGGYWGTNNEAINQFVDLKTYNGPALRHQREGIHIWENGYANLLYYQLIREEAAEEGRPFYEGVARIMQGWHFLRLVDVYDAIPFDEALQGTKYITPAYESGQTVYRKSIDLIRSGIDLLRAAPAGSTVDPGASDIVFQGDKMLWIKFANTIILRALIRQSQAGQDAYIQAELQKIAGEGTGFLGPGEAALVNPGFSSSNPNPFWSTYYRDPSGASAANRENIRPTIFLIDQYKALHDPRLPLLYTEVEGEYRGVLFGNPDVDPIYARDETSAFRGPNENGGAPAALFKSPQQPLVLMGAFESLFLQAEAAERGWLTQTPAEELYEQAIRASLTFMQVDPSERDAYLMQDEVRLSEAADRMARIIQQKWLALNSISSIEAWNDFRRLGLPAIPNSLEAPTPESRPLRMMYPETERMTNNANASLQGNDDILTAPVWWDK